VKISDINHIKSPMLGISVALVSDSLVIVLKIMSFTLSSPNLSYLSISEVIKLINFGHSGLLLFVDKYISASNILKFSIGLITPELDHAATA